MAHQIDVPKKVREILMDQLGCDEVELTSEATLVEDLGADSLDIIEIVMALEEEFDIEINEDKEMIHFTTVQKLIDGISRKIEGKA